MAFVDLEIAECLSPAPCLAEFKTVREDDFVALALSSWEEFTMPSAEEASVLNIARSQPVFDMDRQVWAEDGTLFEYSHIVENSALHEHTYEYEIDEEASK